MSNGEYLVHHGILGQRWGIRRFQNKDGTRTSAGKRREREGGDDAGPKQPTKAQKRAAKKQARQEAKQAKQEAKKSKTSSSTEEKIKKQLDKDVYLDDSTLKKADKININNSLLNESIPDKQKGVKTEIPKSEYEVGTKEYKRDKLSGMKEMSDKELSAVINRMNMEQQYSRMVTSQKTKAQQTVDSIISGTQKTTQVAKTGLDAYDTYKRVKKLFGSDAGS